MSALLAGAVIAGFAAACGGSGDVGDASPTSTVTSTVPAATTAVEPTPTLDPAFVRPTATLAGMYPMDTRTGDPLVDAVLDDLEAHDAAALEARMGYREVACVAETWRHDAPACPAGVAVGTVLRVAQGTQCEGGLRPPEFILGLWEQSMSESFNLYGVYRTVLEGGEPQTIILLGVSPQDDTPILVPLDGAGRIVAWARGCGWYGAPQDADWLLAPKAGG